MYKFVLHFRKLSFYLFANILLSVIDTASNTTLPVPATFISKFSFEERLLHCRNNYKMIGVPDNNYFIDIDLNLKKFIKTLEPQDFDNQKQIYLLRN